MKMTMPREFYIPKDAVLVANPEQASLGLAVYTYEAAGAPYALGFHGKASKPDFHFRFKDDARRQAAIAQFVVDAKASAAYKEKRKAERNQPSTLKLGAILYASWGYDQTNIDFYQVVELVGKNSVKIQKVAQADAPDKPGSQGAEYVVAVPGKFIGEPMLKRVGYGNSVTLTSYSNATPWDGNPKYQTALQAGVIRKGRTT